MSDVPPGPPRPREKLAWCLFDFANSSFTTVIVTVVYARWFVKVIVPGDSWLGVHEDTWWAAAGVASNLVVIFTAPVVGAMADHAAAKKRYLLITTVLCVAGTALLTLFGEGAMLGALLCFIVANVAFNSGDNLIAGFLPELARPSEMGRLSAFGWTIGYFGGLLALVLSLALVNADLTRFVPLATAAFFALAALPTFLYLQERARPRPGRARLVEAAFGSLRRSWSERRQWTDLFRFLFCILLFQGGVWIVISFSAIYAEQEIGMADEDIILMFIGLQIAAAAGAFGFGFIQDRLGSQLALILSIVLWVEAVTIAFMAETALAIVCAGMLAGAAMGSSQAASRALVGLFCPHGREGEWFGLWGLATKASAVLGLAYYGAIMAVFGDRRAAILATCVLFIAGLLALLRVDVNRGRAAAGREERPPPPSA